MTNLPAALMIVAAGLAMFVVSHEVSARALVSTQVAAHLGRFFRGIVICQSSIRFR